jgi:5-methylcytosine-specific restriction endonuclease McrA
MTKTWYQDNSEYHNELTQRYYRENKTEYLARKHQYYAKHKRYHAALVSEWNRLNPDGRRSIKHRYRARKIQAEGNYTAQDMRDQYDRQQGKCYWCSIELNGKYNGDHVIPLSKGGSNWPSNLVCTCESCNKSKQDRVPFTEWQPPNPLMPHEGK